MIRRPAASLVTRVCVVAAACCLAPVAAATQHLISPGGDLRPILDLIEPGDEILLLPGVHQPIHLREIHGERGNPIIIRGLDPDEPAVIRSGDVGIHLIDVAHVQISDIIIKTPTKAGIIIEASRVAGMEEPLNVNIDIANVVVQGVGAGADGERPALRIDAVRDVELSNCTFTGWCGVGCDIVAARDVVLDTCSFADGERTTETMALRIRAGSESIHIQTCSFQQAGTETAVLVGGATGRDQFIPAIEADARAANKNTGRFEASGVEIKSCTFVDQPCPVIFAHAQRVVVRNNTIVRPQRYVMAALQATDDSIMAANRHLTFGQNLITWQAGRLTGVLLLDQANREVSLAFEENLWWSDDPVSVRSRMIPGIARQQFPQVLDIDPKLDEAMRPQIASAQLFGRAEE